MKRGSWIYEHEMLKLLERSGFVRKEQGHESGLKTEPRNEEA